MTDPCCPIGVRPDVADIDAALRRIGEDGAESLSAIAARLEVAKSSLHKHRTLHLRSHGTAANAAERDRERPAEQQTRGAASMNAAGTARNGSERAGTRTSPFAVPNPGDDPETAPRKIVGAQLESAALDLRAAGKSLAKIGEELGIDEETAATLVERALGRVRKGVDAKADKARALEIHRTGLLIAALWARATDPKAAGEPITGEDGEIVGFGYSPAQDKAIERIGKLQEQRAKLLGLNAPVGPKTVINFGEDPNAKQWAAAMLQALDDEAAVLGIADLKVRVVARVREIRRLFRGGAGAPMVIEVAPEPIALPPATGGETT